MKAPASSRVFSATRYLVLTACLWVSASACNAGEDAGWAYGNGLNTSGDSGQPMWLGRYQWNFSGAVLPFSQSALKRYPEARGSLAFAVVTNASRYTRFSSSGGGQLPGFEEGEDNQYRLEQFLQEFAWQHGCT